MSYWVIIIGVFISLLCFGYIRGEILLRKKEKLERGIQSIYGSMDILGEAFYQGGFPPIPKPTCLTIALTESHMILFNKKGSSGRVEYNKMRKVDKIIMQEPKKVRYSLMAWGPLALYFNRPHFQYYLIVKYIDIDEEYNNMVFLLKTQEKMAEYYNLIYPHIKPIRNSSKKGGSKAVNK